MEPFRVMSFMKITLLSPSFDKKEQNCFVHPQFYSSIAPMIVFNNFVEIQVLQYQIQAQYWF